VTSACVVHSFVMSAIVEHGWELSITQKPLEGASPQSCELIQTCLRRKRKEGSDNNPEDDGEGQPRRSVQQLKVLLSRWAAFVGMWLGHLSLGADERVYV
jgi:hypothetical protein